MYVSIPIIPLSVNKAFQGRRFKTKECKDYELKVGMLLGESCLTSGFVRVTFIFTLPPKSYALSDIDNAFKILIDLLVKKGFIEDDRKIIELKGYKKIGDPKVEILIEPINPSLYKMVEETNTQTPVEDVANVASETPVEKPAEEPVGQPAEQTTAS